MGIPPRRILTCVSVFASSRPLCLPAPRNLPTFNHFPTIFTHTATVAQINICKKRIHTPISEAVADVKWYIYDTNSIWTEAPWDSVRTTRCLFPMSSVVETLG